MKTITVPVGFFDDQYVLMDEKKLEAYPDVYRRTLEVKHERLTAGIVLAADAALNRRRELFQESFDGTLKAGVGEGFVFARAVEILTRTVKALNVKDKAGNGVESLGEITEASIAEQSPDVVRMIASRIEFPAIPTPEEAASQGEGYKEKNG